MERSFTTAQMRAFEQENIASMRKGQGMDARLVHSDIVRKFDREFRSLSDRSSAQFGKSWEAMTRSRDSRAWLEAERRRLFGPFGAPRKVKGTRRRVLPPLRELPIASKKPASLPQRCRVFYSKSKPLTLKNAAFSCWTNRVWLVPSR